MNLMDLPPITFALICILVLIGTVVLLSILGAIVFTIVQTLWEQITKWSSSR